MGVIIVVAGVTIVAPVLHVMWRKEWRDLTLIQALSWRPTRASTTTRVHSYRVQPLAVFLMLETVSLDPLLVCQCRRHSLSNNCPAWLIPCCLWILGVVLSTVQQLLLFFMRGVSALLQQGLICLRIMAFFRTLFLHIC